MGSGMMEEKLGGKHAFGLTWPVCVQTFGQHGKTQPMC